MIPPHENTHMEFFKWVLIFGEFAKSNRIYSLIWKYKLSLWFF